LLTDRRAGFISPAAATAWILRNAECDWRVQALIGFGGIAMRRLNVIITGFFVLTLVTACAGAPQQAPRHDPATPPPGRHAPAQGAVAGKYRTGRGTPTSGGQPLGGLPPAWQSCSGQHFVAEASDPLPCAPMLLVPIVVRHPRHGQPRVIYVRKPCFCASGG
jgi:hypothetical protein